MVACTESHARIQKKLVLAFFELCMFPFGDNNQTVTEKIPVAVNKTFAPLTSGGDLLLLENPDRGFRTEIVWDVTEEIKD